MELFKGDCLEKMQVIPEKSIDMILCDLPYGVLNKKNLHTGWDKVIPFDPLWKQYKRIIKDNGAIVLFGSGMFTAQLMTSNPGMWRYNLIWHKDRATGFLNAGKMPLRCHEDICVFYKHLPVYHPQMEDLNGREPSHPQGYGIHKITNRCYGNVHRIETYTPRDPNKKFPQSIVKIPKEHDSFQFHPTQKPVALCEYLIRTFTNEGDVVLDNCMGSGTTGVACHNTRRKFIGIEADELFFEIACIRLQGCIATHKRGI